MRYPRSQIFQNRKDEIGLDTHVSRRPEKPTRAKQWQSSSAKSPNNTMDTFPLNHLPPELLAHVVGAVTDPKDLRNLRLANRALDELATRELFREVYVHIDRLSDEVDKQAFEGVVKIFEKYPHLVQGLDVDGYFGARYDCLCPFKCAPYLDALPNLQWIQMYGTYASWWSEEDSAGQVADVLRRASLLTVPGERVLRGLRSCMSPPLLLFTVLPIMISV